ncbi:hypothetical protein BDN71DRAFT_1502405 [Pleurotus eryngii]|uniref:Uncharacterized protein n=1 Tax=Pleurotus eryngii TaxID=5323 RepID=A0A9P6A8T1_PLEER|nr:hypothetical protein BDN71DRAFT_1502405 [Pleurotus eryngii]
MDEEIDWEALNLFNPLQNGAFGGPPRLSLTDELTAPLFLGFEFNASLLPQFPSGTMEPLLPFLPMSIDINMTDKAILAQAQPAMAKAPAIATPFATPDAPVPTRSNEPADAITNMTDKMIPTQT